MRLLIINLIHLLGAAVICFKAFFRLEHFWLWENPISEKEIISRPPRCIFYCDDILQLVLCISKTVQF